VVGLIVGLFLSTQNLFALNIEFTDATKFSGVQGNSSTVISDPYSQGFDIRLTAKPQPATMTFNFGDGIGITENNSDTGWEYDEIEWQERLAVEFLDNTGSLLYYKLNQIYITDLFYEHGYLEKGRYSLFIDETWTDWTTFTADQSQIAGSTNGEFYAAIGETVQGIRFAGVIDSSYGLFEYSVGGIEISAAPVSEPATMLLLGTGLLGLAGFGRKKIIKK